MHGPVHSPPTDLIVHGSVHISSILRKLIVYLFDVLYGYWKLFMMYETEFGSRTLFAKMVVNVMFHDLIMYHLVMAQLE